MARRIILSVILIPVLALIICADLLRALPFFVFILALSVLAARELSVLVGRIEGEAEAKRLAAGFLAPAPLFLCFSYVKVLAGLPDISLLCAVGALTPFLLFFPPSAFRGSGEAREASRPVRRSLHRSLLLFSVFLYSGVLPFTIFVLRQRYRGAALVAVLLTLAWFSDAAAYFIGSFFGRTKGIVRVSPNKSLEGYGGSFALTIGLSALLPFLFPARFPFGFSGSLGAGLLVAVIAPLGDMGESALKRRAGVKDSAGLLPAFGGVLDIFDSVLSCAPFYLLLSSVVL
jgi:phosphatidate cytidylyltransferase